MTSSFDSTSGNNNTMPTDADDSGASLTSGESAAVRKWLQKHHSKQASLLDKFLLELRLGGGQHGSGGNKTAGLRKKSSTVVLQTVEVFKYVIGPTSWKTAAELLYLVRGVGMEVQAAGGRREPALANLVRRILAAIREEATREAKEESKELQQQQQQQGGGAAGASNNRLSMDSMLWALPQHVRKSSQHFQSTTTGDHQRQQSFKAAPSSSSLDGGPAVIPPEYPPDFYQHRPNLKPAVMEALQELSTDVEDTEKNLREQAPQYIRAGEVLLTCGASASTEAFLLAAATAVAKLKGHQQHQTAAFQVLICEGGPQNPGRAMAQRLQQQASSSGSPLEVIVIPDSSVFAIMSQVHKVLLPSHAVLANGGLIAPSGCHLVALAARHSSVPVMVVAESLQLCPLFPHQGQDTLNELVSPSLVLEYAHVAAGLPQPVQLLQPVRDYVPPDCINLYVTNVGSFQPSFIYRLLAEFYHSDDWEIFD